MALKAEIQSIVAQMSTSPSFIYGTADELNTLADDLPIGQPYVFMYSLQPLRPNFTITNAISNTFSIYMEFLYKIDFDTTTDQCEAYDTQAIAAMNEFLMRLKGLRGTNGGKVFLIDVNDKCTAQPVFNKFDVNTYGRNLTMDLKTTYNELLCL